MKQIQIQQTDVHLYNFAFQNSFEVIQGGLLLGNFRSLYKQYGYLFSDFFEDANVSGDGYFLYVPPNVQSKIPIHIKCYFETPANMRNFVILEAGSSVQLLVSYYSKKEWTKGEIKSTTRVTLCKSATLDMTCFQNVAQMTSNTQVFQAANSRMNTHFVSIYSQRASNNFKATLDGINAEHALHGLSFTQQSEHVENNILIVHKSPECKSSQLFKHILSDMSTGVYHGRVLVSKDAQKTIAHQKSSNILLNAKTKMNIRPHLEIYADDVKCSHGATTGQLDSEAVFYLRSRGMSERLAKGLLLDAFASEVLDSISCRIFKLKMIEKMSIEKIINSK